VDVQYCSRCLLIISKAESAVVRPKIFFVGIQQGRFQVVARNKGA
jgi:hypothetical protein